MLSTPILLMPETAVHQIDCGSRHPTKRKHQATGKPLAVAGRGRVWPGARLCTTTGPQRNARSPTTRCGPPATEPPPLARSREARHAVQAARREQTRRAQQGPDARLRADGGRAQWARQGPGRQARRISSSPSVFRGAHPTQPAGHRQRRGTDGPTGARPSSSPYYGVAVADPCGPSDVLNHLPGPSPNLLRHGRGLEASKSVAEFTTVILYGSLSPNIWS